MTACRFRSIPRSATGISHAARTTESTAATSCGRINGRDDMAAAGRARDRFAKTSYYAGQQSINWPAAEASKIGFWNWLRVCSAGNSWSTRESTVLPGNPLLAWCAAASCSRA